MSFEFMVDGQKYELTPDNASLQLVTPNHVLDHILIVEYVPRSTEPPRWKRAFRELFDNNHLSFNEIAVDFIAEGFIYVNHPDIPQAFEDCYVDSVMRSVDAEWAHYYSKG